MTNLLTAPIDDLIHFDALAAAAAFFRGGDPFDHAVIDGFFSPDAARALAAEFPPYDDASWHVYDNALEVKKTCNNWNLFTPLTYRVMAAFNDPAFVHRLGRLLGIEPLFADPGLNGGGRHIHRPGGKLNTHLDYSIHPKLGLQRKLNLIVYLTEGWQPEWGGDLGLWRHDAEHGQPGELVTKVAPLFNRGVLFDTTQNSWHGLPEPIRSPDGVCRTSLAVYYLTTPPADVDPRGKALFAPYGDQKDDPAVLELIRRRAAVAGAADVYRSR